MAAYSELQQAEFAAEAEGYTATRHQREVGVGYFDAVATAASGGQSSTTASPAAPRRRSSTTLRPELHVHRGEGEGLVHSHERVVARSSSQAIWLRPHRSGTRVLPGVTSIVPSRSPRDG